MSVTRFGVSALNVVATTDRPASHHGTARPDPKNSEVFRPARRPKNNAGPKQISSDVKTMSQSRVARRIVAEFTRTATVRGCRVPGCRGAGVPGCQGAGCRVPGAGVLRCQGAGCEVPAT